MREAKAKMSHFLAIIEYACFFALFYFFHCFLTFFSLQTKKAGKILKRCWKEAEKRLKRGCKETVKKV